MYIITHAGIPHRDDVLAISLALVNFGCCDVYRKDPTPEEITNSDVLVLDVGGLHDESMNCFDHHQFPREHEASCAFTLYARSLGIWDKLVELYPWAAGVPVLDSKGPLVYARSFGAMSFDSLVGAYSNPFESFILNEVKSVTLIPRGCWLHHLLTALGTSLMGGLREFQARMSQLESSARVEEIESVDMLILPDLPDPTRYSAIFKKHWETNNPDHVIGMSIAKDERGPGWALYRFNDDERIDCGLIANEAGVTFTHANGFIAKTADMSLRQALELAGKCVRKHQP